jgi:hypothetical protein
MWTQEMTFDICCKFQSCARVPGKTAIMSLHAISLFVKKCESTFLSNNTDIPTSTPSLLGSHIFPVSPLVRPTWVGEDDSAAMIEWHSQGKTEISYKILPPPRHCHSVYHKSHVDCRKHFLTVNMQQTVYSAEQTYSQTITNYRISRQIRRTGP